jgi:hypothetical protein
MRRNILSRVDDDLHTVETIQGIVGAASSGAASRVNLADRRYTDKICEGYMKNAV